MWITILCLLIVYTNGKMPPMNSRRIFGGDSTIIQKYPYQISLEISKRHVCGGSIISNRWVLTAAHCLLQTKVRRVRVRVGSSIRGQEGQLHSAKKFFIHPWFTERTLDYDFALIEVGTPFEFKETVRPISLPAEELEIPEGTSCVITGWGYIDGTHAVPKNLQVIESKIISMEECASQIRLKLTPRMLCAAIKNKDACAGDSGGPLAVGELLIGVVSFGVTDCGDTRKPGVYGKVSHAMTWLTDKTGISPSL